MGLNLISIAFFTIFCTQKDPLVHQGVYEREGVVGINSDVGHLVVTEHSREDGGKNPPRPLRLSRTICVLH